jgi:hypothetical protein
LSWRSPRSWLPSWRSQSPRWLYRSPCSTTTRRLSSRSRSFRTLAKPRPRDSTGSRWPRRNASGLEANLQRPCSARLRVDAERRSSSVHPCSSTLPHNCTPWGLMPGRDKSISLPFEPSRWCGLPGGALEVDIMTVMGDVCSAIESTDLLPLCRRQVAGGDEVLLSGVTRASRGVWRRARQKCVWSSQGHHGRHRRVRGDRAPSDARVSPPAGTKAQWTRHSGAHAVHFHVAAEATNSSFLTYTLPTGTNTLYMRGWVYLSQQLGDNTASQNDNHETLFRAQRKSGQREQRDPVRSHQGHRRRQRDPVGQHHAAAGLMERSTGCPGDDLDVPRGRFPRRARPERASRLDERRRSIRCHDAGAVAERHDANGLAQRRVRRARPRLAELQRLRRGRLGGRSAGTSWGSTWTASGDLPLAAWVSGRE